MIQINIELKAINRRRAEQIIKEIALKVKSGVYDYNKKGQFFEYKIEYMKIENSRTKDVDKDESVLSEDSMEKTHVDENGNRYEWINGAWHLLIMSNFD